LSEKFTKSTELEIEQHSPPLFSDDEEFDPALADVINLNLNDSQSSEDELSVEFQNYEKTTRTMWKESKNLAAQKYRKEQEAKNFLRFMQKKENTKTMKISDELYDSELMGFFWRENTSKFPILSKVGLYVSQSIRSCYMFSLS